MSEHGTASPGNDPRDEYDELVQLIVNMEWHPGDIVRTSKGVTWQFRETPSTSDIPIDDPHVPERTRKDTFRSRTP